MEKSAVAAHVWKEKHAMDHKPDQLNKETRINKLGKYFYNKKQRLHYKISHPASRSFN